MIPAPGPREVFEWFALAWLALASLALVGIIAASAYRNSKRYRRRCQHTHVLDVSSDRVGVYCTVCGKEFPE